MIETVLYTKKKIIIITEIIVTFCLALMLLKTRKLIGFKSLRLNCSDITQVNIKKWEMLTTVSKILKYYLIQSYLISLRH